MVFNEKVVFVFRQFSFTSALVNIIKIENTRSSLI